MNQKLTILTLLSVIIVTCNQINGMGYMARLGKTTGMATVAAYTSYNLSSTTKCDKAQPSFKSPYKDTLDVLKRCEPMPLQTYEQSCGQFLKNALTEDQIDLQQISPQRDKLLLNLLRDGDRDALSILFKNDLKIDTNIKMSLRRYYSTEERSLLTQACYDHDLTMVNFLIAQGANVNNRSNPDLSHIDNSFKRFFANCTCSNLCVSAFTKIVLCHPDYYKPNYIDEFTFADIENSVRNSPLHYLVFNREKSNPEKATILTKLLLDHGAKIDTKNLFGNTPLHVALAEGNHIMAQILLKNGANAHIPNQMGFTPAFLALLIENGEKILPVDFNLTNAKTGQTALHILSLAKDRGSQERAKYILKNGGNVNIQDKKGKTPLHYAMMHAKGIRDIVPLLLQYGANLYAIDYSGRTPLEFEEEPNREIKTELEDLGLMYTVRKKSWLDMVLCR